MIDAVPGFDQIWRDYRDALYAFLRSRLSNPADAEDLLQEILLKSHQNLPKLRDSARLKSWLFQIAANALTDHYRTQARGRDVHPDDLWYHDKDEARALANCVMPFVAALPDDQAALLRAIEIEGRTQKELAEDMGLAYSTLKSRVAKARTELRGLFENCCDFAFDARGDVMDYSEKATSCKNC